MASCARRRPTSAPTRLRSVALVAPAADGAEGDHWLKGTEDIKVWKRSVFIELKISFLLVACRFDLPDLRGLPTCTLNRQCEATAATPICDPDSRTCVQCTFEANACTGTAPVCSSENTCVQCRKHTECASSACLPDGACGDSSSVAFVAPSGTDNAQCSLMMPCRTVAAALQLGRPYVKLSGTTFGP